MELFFDTETSGLFNFKNPDYTASDFPWVVQLGAVLAEDGVAYAELNVIVKPGDRTIEPGAQKVHNISVELADEVGINETTMAKAFLELILNADLLVAHNMSFDSTIMLGVFQRQLELIEGIEILKDANKLCTMKSTTNLCRLPGRYGKFKWPKLQELHNHLFGENFVGAHDAMFDIKATMKCFYELKRIGWIK